MNPLLDGMQKMQNIGRGSMNSMGTFLNNSPIGNVMQFISEYRKIKANPSELGQFLYSKGKITQGQLDEINKMNGDPTKIGEYLIQSGSIPQNELNGLQNSTAQMQQYINTNSPK